MNFVVKPNGLHRYYTRLKHKLYTLVLFLLIVLSVTYEEQVLRKVVLGFIWIVKKFIREQFVWTPNTRYRNRLVPSGIKIANVSTDGRTYRQNLRPLR